MDLSSQTPINIAIDELNRIMRLADYSLPASEVVSTPSPNKILRLNANSKLPANLAGNADTASQAINADTVDGAHAGNSANNVLKLNSNGLVPCSNLPKATEIALGAIKIGSGLTIDSNGLVNVLPGITIGMIKGVISNGGTLPLPSGFTHGECNWIVTPYRLNNGNQWDSIGFDDLVCNVDDTTRVVTVGHYRCNDTWISGQGNYLVIGVK